MAATTSELPALERQVLQLLSDLPTCGSNAEQLALFQRVQELVLHRDPTGDAHALLHAAAPFLPSLAQLQNAALVAALLQLLAQAAKRNATFLRELYDVVNAVVMLSFTTEKNVLSAIHLALTSLSQAFVFAHGTSAPDARKTALWAAVTLSLEHMVEIVATTPLLPIGGADANNNRSAAVWLRAWKCLESAALMLSPASDAAMYRDPARSNVQPDAITVDRVAPGHPVLDRQALEALGQNIVRILCDRIGQSVEGASAMMLQALSARELCVAINSLGLLAALRPHVMATVLPALVAFQTEALPGTLDDVVLATLKANLVKLLSHPSAQAFADEVTECLITLGASERAFRAISKSKEPRRMYVAAPTEASLRKARVSKRTAQSIAEKVENDVSKRQRIGASGSRSRPSSRNHAPSSGKITHEAIVNMASFAVVNLVLESFTAPLPTPAPPALKLELTPSELKSRMLPLLAKLATPSSALAIETSAKRMRDPRRRRDPRVAQNLELPALVQIFDSDAVEEVSEWVSKNASAVAEPLVSVTEDNVVQVFLKPATPLWCREMAVAALNRILENEHGVRIRGDEALRERVLCRLASSPWLLLTDAKNQPLDLAAMPSTTGGVPSVYQTILDFVLDDVAVRSTLALALFFHEYARFTAQDLAPQATEASPPSPSDAIYKRAVAYFFAALVKKIDLSATADKKLVGALVAQLPRVTPDVLTILSSLFDSKSGVVLGITVLRDLIKERAACQTPALRILLRYTCHDDEHTRNSAIRCVANQLYTVDALRDSVERFAIRLVESLGAGDTAMEDASDRPPTETAAAATTTAPLDPTAAPPTRSRRQQWLRDHVHAMTQSERALDAELLAIAAERESEIALSKPLESEPETLRRIELYLALCAKKPTLLTHIVAAYAQTLDSVRQVIFHAIEKLIKHLKQRGSANVVAQLHGFEANALGLVCHVIQILSVRGNARPQDENAATAELVHQVLALYHAHTQVPDAISVVIPILPSMRAHVLFPLLPALLALPHARLAVAITRLLEAMPPQVVAPIDLLVALHHVDLKAEASMQKKVISAINLCVEHRHAFPSDVLLHVCRVLVQDERISKLALRTLILSVTAYPALQQDMVSLLEILVARRVWEMEEDALWKGFVKCAALIQPASFPLLLQRLPVPQLQSILDDEPELRALLQLFAASPEAAATLRLSPDVAALLAMPSSAKTEAAEANGMSTSDSQVKDEPPHASAGGTGDPVGSDSVVAIKCEVTDESVVVKQEAMRDDVVMTSSLQQKDEDA